MSDVRPHKQNWLVRSAVIAAAVVTFISTTLGVFVLLENRVKDAMTTNTQQLTYEIKQSAVDLASMHRDDLEVRIRIKKREIQSLRDIGNPVPERLHIEYDALNDQLNEVKEKWFVQ